MLKATHQGAAPTAKSDVYDRLVKFESNNFPDKVHTWKMTSCKRECYNIQPSIYVLFVSYQRNVFGCRLGWMDTREMLSFYCESNASKEFASVGFKI